MASVPSWPSVSRDGEWCNDLELPPSPTLYDAVQAQLGANRRKGKGPAARGDTSMLSGLVADADGERLTATPTLKGKRCYRYYAGQALRIPAEELETLVCDALHEQLANPAKLVTPLPDLGLLSTSLI